MRCTFFKFITIYEAYHKKVKCFMKSQKIEKGKKIPLRFEITITVFWGERAAVKFVTNFTSRLFGLLMRNVSTTKKGSKYNMFLKLAWFRIFWASSLWRNCERCPLIKSAVVWFPVVTYSRVSNKRIPTFINFWNFFQGLWSYYGLKRLKFYYISLRVLRGYIHFFICYKKKREYF